MNHYGFEVLPEPKIYSFVNCFDSLGHFAGDWQLFSEVERTLPEWEFKSFGGQCRDGAIGPSTVLADKIREARFIWHTKNGGDGYGHVIHNAPACGKPLIVKKEYYVDKLAEPLLIDGVTCIAIDGLSCQQVVNKIEFYSQPEEYSKMAQASYENFKRVVDFEREAEEIQKFLAKLI